MALLEITRLCKSFGATTAVDDVSLTVAEGEIVCLLGPSGCGKTTLLRLVAGLETADSGAIHFDDRNLAAVPVHQRNFGLMFQDYALFPHKNVAQNVAFGLQMANLDREVINGRVREALEMVGLTGMSEREIATLSGGEQQRVALARSLAPSPRLLLLDEPLGSLDQALRERLMNELRAILKRVGVTAITVTHDQQEAFALADRIVVMESGRALQIGRPEEVYRRPATPAVARFLGLTNLLEGHVIQTTPLTVETAIGVFPLDHHPSPITRYPPPVTVLIHPEAASTCPTGGAALVEGTLTGRSFRGGHYQVEVAHPAGPRLTFALRAAPFELPPIGQPIQLYLDPNAITLLPNFLVPNTQFTNTQFTIHKLDAHGQRLLSYPGRVLARTTGRVTLEATFRRGPMSLEGITLRPGDRFVEHYFADRWYNVFEIYDVDDGRFKGWYCNVSRPAVITQDSVSAEDLVLDLLVEPNGRATILDQDEFDALALPPDERKAALAALEELQALAVAGKLSRVE